MLRSLSYSAPNTAYTNGIIQINISEDGTNVDYDTSQKLSHKYECVDQAIVIRFPISKEGSLRDPSLYSDYLHKKLGEYAAKFIVNYVRDGDKIGFASGRGPYYSSFFANQMWHSIHHSTEKLMKDMTLISMTGRVSPSQWKNHPDLTSMDADDASNSFAGICANPTTKKATIPLGLDKKKSEISEFKYDLLFDEWKEGKCPNWAVVGVGVLVGGHRFLSDPIPSAFEHMREQIRQLQDIVKPYTNTPCPIGDICNRPFIMEEFIMDDQIHKLDSIRKLTNDINDQLYSVTDNHLQKINRLLIVAGGIEKAYAIDFVLKNKPLDRVILFTDRDCGSKMLEIED